jgi:hypothetical protein
MGYGNSSESSGSKYDGMTNKDINDSIGDEQRNLLKEFFGQGKQGADDRAANFNVPKGLSNDTLNAYKEVAERQIAAGKDSTGVQNSRLQLILRVFGDPTRASL